MYPFLRYTVEVKCIVYVQVLYIILRDVGGVTCCKIKPRKSFLQERVKEAFVCVRMRQRLPEGRRTY